MKTLENLELFAKKSELKDESGKDTLSKIVKKFVKKKLLDNLPEIYLFINMTYALEEQSKPKNKLCRIRLQSGRNTLLSLFLGGNLIM